MIAIETTSAPTGCPVGMTEIAASTRGELIVIRPVLPDDAEDLQTFFRLLSNTSRRNRLFGPGRELSHELLDRFTKIDYRNHFALVATALEDGHEIVGEARFVIVDSGEAEFAVTVADAWQGRGIGTLLMSRLLCHAQEEGVERLFGDVLLSNRAMQRLGGKLGFVSSFGPPGLGLARLELSLADRRLRCEHR